MDQLDLESLALAACLVGALGAGCYAILGRFAANGSSRRLSQAAGRAQSRRQGAGAGGRGAGDAPLVAWFAALATRLDRAAKPGAATPGGLASAVSPLRLRLLRAGHRDAAAPGRYLMIRAGLMLSLPLLAALVYALTPQPFIAAVLAGAMLTGAAAGYCLPSFWLDACIGRRQAALAAHFPDAIDMVRLCVEAGLGLEAAMTRVEREVRFTCMPLYDELHMVNLEIRAGAARARALRNLALRVGLPEIDALMSMLVQVERLGTSVAEGLRVHSEVLRAKRRQRAQEQAAKVPVKLLFPMIFCIFPALMIVLLGPAVIAVMRTLASSLALG